jgi:hypothetical protein
MQSDTVERQDGEVNVPEISAESIGPTLSAAGTGTSWVMTDSSSQKISLSPFTGGSEMQANIDTAGTY